MEASNKTALVTGGSRGIGREICIRLAKAGYNVVTCYASSSSQAEEVVRACGENAEAYRVDVSDSAAVAELVEKVREKYGRIDVLVNNAGVTRDNLILKMKEDEFDEVINTNLKGAYLCTQQVSRLMLKQKSGRIINISSVVGLRGNAGQANYAASKAGIIGMTKSVAKELASRGITVNAVAPGFIETEMTAKLSDSVVDECLKSIPMRCMGRAKDVADLVAFLASDEARYITGQVICVDGGMAM